MANILDYLAWRGDLPFSAAPFCEVDNLLLSMLSFINYEGIVSDDVLGNPVKLGDCLARHTERYPDGQYFGQIIPQVTGELFEKAAQSVRFHDTYVTAFRAETDAESQFAAVTFILPDNSLFAAFRGTDDTLVGWREDFNLSFQCPVPAQAKSVDYLTEVASVYRGPIRTGGHSKGGNLAVFSAVFSPAAVRERILTAYSNDGPGFVDKIVQSPAFQAMENRIYTLVPQSSVIGMLLEHKEEYQVIESTLNNGLFQHDPFSWSVLGPTFVHREELSEKGKRHDAVLSAWLADSPPEERQQFTETVFHVLDATGAKTVSDLTVDAMGKISAAVRTFHGLDRDTRERVLHFIRKLAEANMNH